MSSERNEPSTMGAARLSSAADLRSPGGIENVQPSVRGGGNLSSSHVFRTLLITFLVATVATAAYEAAKHLAFPHLTLWQSHALTALFIGVVSTLAVYLAQRWQSELLARARTQLAERERAEEKLRQTSEALRQSEETYRSIVLNVPDVVWTLDAQGGIVFVSPNVIEFSGYTVDEMRQGGLAFFLSTVHPEDLPMVVETVQGAFAGASRRHLEYRARRKDGQWIWVRARTVGVFEKDGRRYLQGLMTDITKRKQAEAEHFRLVTAIEQSAEAVVITDTQGTIEYVNPAFTRITGYSREEALGQNPRILKSDKQDKAFYRQLWETILKGENWHGELINRRKDGKHYTEELNIAPVRNARGEVTHFIATKQDVSSRRQLEQQVRLVQRVEAIGRMAGGVAHDFNNLLTIISGYGQLLQDRLGPEDRGAVEEILKAAERAASLTRQLLAFSRRQILAPQVLDLNTVVANTEKMLRRLIGEDIELATALRPDLGHVRADPGQIEQIIMNLVVNSRDAMPEGGKVTVETANVELDEPYSQTHAGTPPGPYVMLAVSDNGMGMDAETQSHIFEPFFTTKDVGKGTGLGLATVYGVVKQSGGYIWVYSEPGQGTTFKIYLPRVDEAVTKAGPGKAGPLSGGSETVLVVEDEEGVRSLICKNLEALGYKVLHAPDPNSALAILEQYGGPIHLLLTDLIMPRMSGKELAKHAAATRPDSRVLYISGYTDDAVFRHGILEAGASFLQKPFTPDALLRKVREVLDAQPQT